MAFPQLPPEVVLQIVKHQPENGDLCAAALTCRALRDEAQQVLFHTPVPRTAYHHLIFMDAILSSPDKLGPMVRDFVHVSGSAYCGGRDKVLVEKTRRMLRAMSNLKRLAFSNAMDLPMGILFGTTFQLDAFDWGSGRSAKGTDILCKFLRRQPGLKHLTLPGIRARVAPENVKLCPQLRSLTGGSAAVKLFVMGKRVTHLQWMPESTDEALFDAQGLESELERVHFLRCRIQRQGLPRFASKMRSLVLLELIGDGNILNSEYQELQLELAKLPTLQVLILVGYVPLSHVYPNSLHPGSVARDIFSGCPYLEHIDISIAPSDVRHEQFRRFYRAETLEGIDPVGILVEEATVYEWSLSRFGGVAPRIQPGVRTIRAT